MTRWLQVKIDASETRCGECELKGGWSRMRCRLFREPLDSSDRAHPLNPPRCSACIEADMGLNILSGSSGLDETVKLILASIDPPLLVHAILDAVFPLVPRAIVKPLYDQIAALEKERNELIRGYSQQVHELSCGTKKTKES